MGDFTTEDTEVREGGERRDTENAEDTEAESNRCLRDQCEMKKGGVHPCAAHPWPLSDVALFVLVNGPGEQKITSQKRTARWDGLFAPHL